MSDVTSFLSLKSPTKSSFLFFFNDTATTEIYTLSLHDALPICCAALRHRQARSADTPPDALRREHPGAAALPPAPCQAARADRKSTRLNSSHSQISYAVFCLKKKKNRVRGDAGE